MDPISRRTETHDSSSEGRPARRIVVVLFSLVEVVFAFRLLFKLFGANGSNGFVKGLYAVTQPIVGLFEGIFPKPATTGSVLEPATIIAIVIVGLLAWAVLKIMGGSTQRIEKTQVSNSDVPRERRSTPDPRRSEQPATTTSSQPATTTTPATPQPADTTEEGATK
jgi:hypothetical protein